MQKQKNIPKKISIDLYNEWEIEKNLKNDIKQYKKLKKRYFVEKIEKFVLGKREPRICGLYGLRRTGKTIAMFHTMDMLLEKNKKVAFLVCKENTELDKIYEDIRTLGKNGYKYIFIDEISFVEGFIQCANGFSDELALSGLKIVIAGTDSYVLKMASWDKLYDRINLINTTYISYKEYKYLYGNKYTIYDYLKFGGTLNKDEFYEKTHTAEYIKTSISQNIINTIKKVEEDNKYLELSRLEAKGLLNKAIEQTIQDQNTELTVNTIIDDFKNKDLSLSIKNSKDKYSYNELDKEELKQKLMKKLSIINNNEIKVKENILKELKDVLKEINVFEEYNKINLGEEKKVYLFTQNGLRYKQAEELIKILKRDNDFNKYDDIKKNFLTTKIEETICGMILEHTVINACLETKNYTKQKAKGKLSKIPYKITQITKNNGEWDMVIYNDKIKDIYEIKLSNKQDEYQYRWLIDEAMEEDDDIYSKYDIGKKTRNRIVLYLGKDTNVEVKTKNGKKMKIQYKNIEKFLLNLDEKNIF